MSESLTQLYLSNPALAGAIRRQQFGQGLAQHGLDTSPTSGWGALARLAQAYVGGRLMDSGQEEANKAGEAQRQEAMAFLGTPQAAGLPTTVGTGVGGAGQPQTAPMPSGATNAMPPPELIPHYEEASKETGIPVQILYAKDRQESNFNNSLRGGAGEIGISQILPSTAKAPGFGVQAVDPTTLSDPRNNILFGARYFKGRGDAAGVTDWSNPAEWAKALAGYNGGGDPNYVANVMRWVQANPSTSLPVMPQGGAGGGAQPPSGAPGMAAPPPGGGAAPPGMAAPPPGGGAAAPGGGAPAQPSGGGSEARTLAGVYLQHAQDMRQKALQASMSTNLQIRQSAPQLAALAASYQQQATTFLTMDQWEPYTLPDGTRMQRNTKTGERRPEIPGTSRTVVGENGDIWEFPAGGGAPRVVWKNTTGVTGSGEDASASRTLEELAPKIRDGSASQDEVGRYAKAAETWIKRQTVMDPATHQQVSVPTRQWPSHLPLPPTAKTAPPANSAPAPSPAAPSPTTQETPAFGGTVPLTGGGFGREAAVKVDTENATKDIDRTNTEEAKILDDRKLFQTTQNIRALTPGVTTGKWGEARGAMAQYLTSLGVPEATVKSVTGTSAPDYEMLRKTLYELAMDKTRGMGREPGYIFDQIKANLPNLTDQRLTIEGITRFMDAMQYYRQDEIKARASHLTTEKENIRSDLPYKGLSNYKEPDVRAYAAAGLAAAGLPMDQWAKGLTNEQKTEALRLASKMWPDAAAMDGKGQLIPLRRAP